MNELESPGFSRGEDVKRLPIALIARWTASSDGIVLHIHCGR